MGRLKQPEETSTYTFYNANPKGHRTDDCVVRAIAAALDQSWSKTLKDLTTFAVSTGYMVTDVKCYSRYLESKGWVKQTAPRKAGNKRYTGKDIGKILYKPAVMHMGGHHLTYFDGTKVKDIWDCTEGSVGNYWIKVISEKKTKSMAEMILGD